jgi:hypothetical protein
LAYFPSEEELKRELEREREKAMERLEQLEIKKAN